VGVGSVGATLPGGDQNDLAVHLDTDAVTVPTMIYEDHQVEWADREKRRFGDKWGALQQYTEEALPVPIRPARIETPEDLACYRPPDPPGSLTGIRRAFNLAV